MSGALLGRWHPRGLAYCVDLIPLKKQASDAKRAGLEPSDRSSRFLGLGAVTTEHVDVLLIDAGVSGIASACHLVRHCRWARFVMLEAEASFGDTVVH